MLVVAFFSMAASLGVPADAAASLRPALRLSADTDVAVIGRIVEGAARARARYFEGDFEGATAAVAEVEADFIGAAVDGCVGPDCVHTGPAFSVDARAWDAWTDAQATRGLATQRLQDHAGMDAIFRGIVAVRPAWQPDRGFVPPKQLQRFEALRQTMLSTPMVALTIDVEGGGEVVLDGRIVPRGVPVDVAPGRHFVGVGGRGRVVVVDAPARIALAGAQAPARTLIEEPLPPPVAEDGPPWGLIAGGAIGVVVVTGVVVGVVIALSQPAAVPNPGGVTILVDTSRLNGVAP